MVHRYLHLSLRRRRQRWIRDRGLGIASVAREYRLGFVPLLRGRFDILVWRRSWFEGPFQALAGFCQSEAFRDKAEELGGYDVSGFGTVHYNGP